MFDSIAPRPTEILRLLAAGKTLARAEVEAAIGESRITAIRELNRLAELGYVSSTGEARATTYTITDQGPPGGAMGRWAVPGPGTRPARSALQPFGNAV